MGRHVVIAIVLLLAGGAGSDRARWQSVPAVAALAAGAEHSRPLIIDAFLQARGMAPGSPALGWDRVQYHVARGDLTPDPGDEVAVAGTVLPEDGFLIVYARSQVGDDYTVRAYHDNLARVERLRLATVTPVGSQSDLVVLHSYNEMCGAFFRWERLLYLRFVGQALHPVLELVTVDESYSLDPPMAIRHLREETVVTEGPGRVETAWHQRRWQRGESGEYQLHEETRGTSVFLWDGNELRLAAENRQPRY